MRRILPFLLILFLLCLALPALSPAEEDWEEWEEWDGPWTEGTDAAWEDTWEDDWEPEWEEAREDVLESGDFLYVLNEDGTCTLTGWTGTEDHLAIPERLEGRPVTALADGAFADAEILSVSIPLSVTGLGSNPFLGCTSLVSIDVPEDHPALYVQDDMLFAREGSRLVTWPAGLAAGACVVPAGTLAIGENAFAWCERLVRVQLCSGLREIGPGAFSMCTSLTGIDLPDSIEVIGASAFSGSGLERIVLPLRLTALEDRVFFDCAALADIWLPPGLTAIGDEAFAFCSMERITLPEGISYLGVNPFVGCYNLQEVALPPDHPVYALEGALLVDRTEMRVITCLNYVIGDFTIPEGIVSIGDYAFFGCSELTDIHFPSTLREIGFSGFTACMSCTVLRLNEGLEAIGDLAFGDCFLLEEIHLPASLVSLGEEVFDSCDALRAVYAAPGSAAWAWGQAYLLPLQTE